MTDNKESISGSVETTPLVTTDTMSITVDNKDYEPEGEMMWHVYLTQMALGNDEYAVSLGILKTDKPHEEISEWVSRDMFNGEDYTHVATFDHEPTEEEKDALYPTHIA